MRLPDAVIGQGGGQRNAVSQGAAADLQRTEQPGKLTALTHISSRDKRLWLMALHSTMGSGRPQGMVAIFCDRYERFRLSLA